MTPRFSASLTVLLALLASAGAASAQTTPASPGGGTTRGEAPPPPPIQTAPPPAPVEAARGVAYLSAAFVGSQQPLRGGLVWRVYRERAEDDGSRPLVFESREAAPAAPLPDGAYVAHVAYGLASAARRVVVAGAPVTERLTLNAGALRIQPMLGDQPIARNRATISVFVPEKGNPEGKLVVSGAQPGDVLRLPEGAYHIVSTYLDQIAPSLQATAPRAGESAAPRQTTNSVVAADLRVPTGKLIEARLAHRAATLTLKLVNAPGGEALPNTVFTVLTPGGDVVRELIGAFPSLVLAEGEYVAIARHQERTYQTTFRVTSALDRDVEVVAQ
ncbi:MAG: hypothetical protein JNK46_13360 [Methylobacteriaceae bacterium]|nr:hypothetical protein [Methylobacteriaceae bacterium]